MDSPSPQRKLSKPPPQQEQSVSAPSSARSTSYLSRIKNIDPTIKYFSVSVLFLAFLLWWGRTSCLLITPTVRRERVRATVISQAAMAFTLNRPKFILFGDSLTERGFGPGGWAAGLAHQYQRRVDVINRGLGGYNTRWALHVVPDVLAGVTAENTRLVTLFLGANDAARPDGPSHVQHVPVKEYAQNLKQLVSKVRATGVKRIVLLTPPPVHNQGRKDWQVVKVGAEVAAGLTLDRTLDFTAAYAAVCLDVGNELSVPVVDLFESMQDIEDWGPQYFVDGLHFTPQGNQVALEHLLAKIKQVYPELNPESMPLHFPPWDAINGTVLAGLTALRKQGPFAESPLPTRNQPATPKLDSNAAEEEQAP